MKNVRYTYGTEWWSSGRCRYETRCAKSYLRSICNVKGVLSGNLLRTILLGYQAHALVWLHCVLTRLFLTGTAFIGAIVGLCAAGGTIFRLMCSAWKLTRQLKQLK